MLQCCAVPNIRLELSLLSHRYCPLTLYCMAPQAPCPAVPLRRAWWHALQSAELPICMSPVAEWIQQPVGLSSTLYIFGACTVFTLTNQTG